MKKKLTLFIAILCFGIIFTYTAFPTSHALDSYCMVCNGYNKTALWFLQNGRVVTYLFYHVMNFIHMPMNTLGYVSAFLANVCFSVAITSLFYKLKNNLKIDNPWKKGILLLALFLLYYNPLLTSILLLDEVCVIACGIMLFTLSSIKLFNGGIKNYLLAFIFCLIGVFCYQGIASYLFVTMFILLITDNKLKIKDQLFRIIFTIINYIVSFLSNYLIIRFVYNKKFGQFNIIKNINHIINNLLPDALKNYYHYISYVKIYYILVLLSIVLLVVFIILNRNKLKNIIYSICLIISSIIIPFIPNVFMASNMNYSDAKMTLTIVSVPICLLVVVIIHNTNKIMNYITCFVLIMYLAISGYSVHQNMKIDIKRFKNDTAYLAQVNSKIYYYEKRNNIKVKKVYYAYDIDSAYYYNFGYNNGANIRLMKVNWAFECSFKTMTKKQIKIEKMLKKDYIKYFDGLNYNKFNSKQFIFDNDTLYLLIY